ncbi:MAG: bifunctional diaminohydroxyphosphoribosylaminopyrimidine deaminase/5-amino-6-(5-phosphoribosylamino)uracil reductase RibD [Verrucomicrobiota bacterium]
MPPTPRENDEAMMRLAIREARKGIGKTAPNPAVGAVLVRKGKILSRGWHRAAGCPHAEIEALKKTSDALGATLYVTLEPCSTHGRTPPCTSAIIQAGIARAVFGATDPNPAHAGRATAILQKAGIEVSSGILSSECALLNRAWNKWISTGQPYVTAKAGMSLDGRIASPPDRRWITSEAARRDAMELRAECDAILVGAETIRIDNPHLTLRGLRAAKQPWRVVWSRSGKIPKASNVLTDIHRERTLVFSGKNLRTVLKELGGRGVQHVLIEGGGRTLGEAFDKELVDRVVFYIAPILMGGPIPALGGSGVASNEEGLRLRDPVYKKIGPDLRIEGEITSRSGGR